MPEIRRELQEKHKCYLIFKGKMWFTGRKFRQCLPEIDMLFADNQAIQTGKCGRTTPDPAR
jgi:hypothetical protein